MKDVSVGTTHCRTDSRSDAPNAPDQAGLRERIAPFQSAHVPTSVLQAATTIGGYLGTCAAIYWALDVSYWLAGGLVPVAIGLLVRSFIIQHDCGHGAYFPKRKWNDALGMLCSVLTFTPYLSWKRQHAGHHGTWNNLDARDAAGVDIYSTCLTVEEYQAFGPLARSRFRVTRHPIVANIILPPLVFLMLYRVPFDMPAHWVAERRGVYLTDGALLAVYGGLALVVGIGPMLIVQGAIMVGASIVGVWLFTVQHRSPDVRWIRREAWSAGSAALTGSTYFCLPSLLQWFTGNIGLHHIHHLNARIPNYRLQECLDAVPELREVPTVTLGSSFHAVRFVLWDERAGRMTTLKAVAAG
jgi:omega-6 fatty acid desaturase (delta-12 desaturase)